MLHLNSQALQPTFAMAADKVIERFHELFTQNKPEEAADLLKTVLDQLAEANTQLAIVKTQLAELQTHDVAAAAATPKEAETSHEVTIFSPGEIAAATKNYGESEKIGNGQQGSVYKGFLRHTHVAIKVLNQESARGSDKEFKQEVETLTKVRHPHLVSLIGASPEAHALVYDYLPNGSLESYLLIRNNNKKLPWQDRIRIASEICSALIFLHSQAIAHGNLKPENVLLDNNLVSKLTDFGLSRKLQSSNDTVTPLHVTGRPRGSLAYIDPEFLAFGELTPQSDVFAFGIILLQFVTGRDARGLRSTVEQAIVNKAKLEKLVDISAGKWPIAEAMKLAQLGLDCSHQMRKRRANLTADVWPKLDSMRSDQQPKITPSSSGKLFKLWG